MGARFTGGTVVELPYDKPVKTEDVRVQQRAAALMMRWCKSLAQPNLFCCASLVMIKMPVQKLPHY